MRSRGTGVLLALAVLAVSCGDDGQRFETESGLSCPTDLFESSIADHAADAVGFDSPELATDDWWTNGDGSFRSDPDMAVTVEVMESRSRFTYRTDDDHAVLILEAVDYGNGWLFEQSEGCAEP